MPVEHREADLGCMRLDGELRFNRKCAADRHAIAAPDKLSRLIPDFERMRITGVMQLRIGMHDAWRNPRQVPLAAAPPGAGLDYRLKGGIERHAMTPLA